MLMISDIKLVSLITHYVGNPAAGDTLHLSDFTADLGDTELTQVLLQYFLTPLHDEACYNLWHPADANLNKIKQVASKMFASRVSLVNESRNIAKHLFDITSLPQIKSGELHIAYFTGCAINGVLTDAVGIFKTESKSRYLKISKDAGSFYIESEEGFSAKLMDKGCLIFNVNQEDGYLVHVFDKNSKNGETQFWRDSFLGLRSASDEYHATDNFMKMSRLFIVDQVPAEFEVTRVDQIDFLNKSLDYFKKNEEFNKEEFQEEVLRDPDLIKSFRTYEKQYSDDYEENFPERFDISAAAVKKNGRLMKSVLKLDKNFHVYVHGNRELIERGFDEKTGMNYYKIFFETEV